MRIGNESIWRSQNNDLNELLWQQMKLQYAMSTGRVVNKPSEGGGQSTTIMRDHVYIDRINQYRSNLEVANNWMTTSEDNMQSMVDILKRAQTLAEQLSTGTYNEEEQGSAAAEVTNLMAELITLGNSTIDGAYIFGGTRTDEPPLTNLLMASDPATLAYAGHGLVAGYYGTPPPYQLALSNADGSPIDVSILGGTLGDSVGFSFEPADWSVSPDGLTLFTNNSVLLPTDPISNLVGEELSWVGDPLAGTQTFRTEAVITFNNPGARLTIDGVEVPPAPATINSAADMVNQINEAGGDRFYAYLDAAGDVHVASKGGAPFNVAQTFGLPGDLTVDTDTSIADLQAALNTGVPATGMIQIADDGTPDWTPLATDTVTLGDDTWSWQEITDYWTVTLGNPAPASSDDYGQALAAYVNDHQDAFTAQVVTNGAANRTTVQITTVDGGSWGNVALLATPGRGVTSTQALHGGIEGTPAGGTSTGNLYATGTSDLWLDTDLRCRVLDVNGPWVTLRVSWHDNEGALRNEEITLMDGGEQNAVKVPGLGDISLYMDNYSFEEGSVFDLHLGHYQGNNEDLEVAFSRGNDMRYNWNAEDLLGEPLTTTLWGVDAEAWESNSGPQGLHLTGVYREKWSRDYQFEIVEGGTIPGDQVTVRITWNSSDGLTQTKDVLVPGSSYPNSGEGAKVALPDADGAYFYLDNATYQEGDNFSFSIDKKPLQMLDVMRYWQLGLESGDQELAQTRSQAALDTIGEAIANILDYIADSGVRQARVTARETVLDQQELNVTDDLTNLEEVDLTKALLQLQMVQTAYNASLKTTSTIADLSLLSYL